MFDARATRIPAPALFALLLAGLVACAGCAGGGPRPETIYQASPDAAGVQRVRVNLHSFYFEPSRIVVHAAHPVELTLHDSSLFVPHNFTIADSSLSISKGVGPKRTHVVRFTPEQTGEFEFFCHVDHHAKKGMRGTLVVVP
ncbi:MAG: cupredoxin domain-containing protein [Hyphomicrobiales bacterium]